MVTSSTPDAWLCEDGAYRMLDDAKSYDGVHLTQAGYEAWASAIHDFVKMYVK